MGRSRTFKHAPKKAKPKGKTKPKEKPKGKPLTEVLKEDPIVSSEELDLWYVKDRAKYDAAVEKIAADYKRALQTRIESGTKYPKEQILQMKIIIHAIDKGIWHPTTPKRGAWRMPKFKNPVEAFLQS